MVFAAAASGAETDPPAGHVDAFQRLCASCHSGDSAPGGLRLDSAEAVQSGSSLAKEIVRRMTLPADHPQAMPPANIEERPSPADIAAARAWADSLREETALPPSPEAPPSASAVAALKAAGAFVSRLSLEASWLHVDASGLPPDRLAEAIALLPPLAEWLYELDVSNAQIGETEGAVLAQLRSLRKLNLTGAELQNAGWLAELRNLQSLNLYAARSPKEALDAAASLPNLQRLYIAQTELAPGDVQQLQEMRPDLRIFYKDLKNPLHAIAWGPEQLGVWRQTLSLWSASRGRKWDEVQKLLHPQWSAALAGRSEPVDFEAWKAALERETRGRSYPLLRRFPTAIQIAGQTAAVYSRYYISYYEGDQPVQASEGLIVEVWVKTDGGWKALAHARMEAPP